MSSAIIGDHRGPRLHAQGSVLRVELERLPGRQRKPAILWLWWQGPPGQEAPTVADLEHCWKAYARRYDLEQTVRFLKQALGLAAAAHLSLHVVRRRVK